MHPETTEKIKDSTVYKITYEKRPSIIKNVDIGLKGTINNPEKIFVHDTIREKNKYAIFKIVGNEVDVKCHSDSLQAIVDSFMTISKESYHKEEITKTIIKEKKVISWKSYLILIAGIVSILAAIFIYFKGKS